MSSPAWAGPAELGASRALAAAALAPLPVTAVLALQSNLPLLPRLLLVLAVVAATLAALLDLRRRAPRRLRLDPGTGLLHWADARGAHVAPLAGWSLLGTLAIRLHPAGHEPLWLPRDAMAPGDFRRLRAWLLLGGGRLA